MARKKKSAFLKALQNLPVQIAGALGAGIGTMEKAIERLRKSRKSARGRRGSRAPRGAAAAGAPAGPRPMGSSAAIDDPYAASMRLLRAVGGGGIAAQLDRIKEVFDAFSGFAEMIRAVAPPLKRASIDNPPPPPPAPPAMDMSKLAASAKISGAPPPPPSIATTTAPSPPFPTPPPAASTTAVVPSPPLPPPTKATAPPPPIATPPALRHPRLSESAYEDIFGLSKLSAVQPPVPASAAMPTMSRAEPPDGKRDWFGRPTTPAVMTIASSGERTIVPPMTPATKGAAASKTAAVSPATQAATVRPFSAPASGMSEHDFNENLSRLLRGPDAAQSAPRQDRAETSLPHSPVVRPPSAAVPRESVLKPSAQSVRPSPVMERADRRQLEALLGSPATPPPPVRAPVTMIANSSSMLGARGEQQAPLVGLSQASPVVAPADVASSGAMSGQDTTDILAEIRDGIRDLNRKERAESRQSKAFAGTGKPAATGQEKSGGLTQAHSTVKSLVETGKTLVRVGEVAGAITAL